MILSEKSCTYDLQFLHKYSVCGNKIILCQLDIPDQTLREANALSKLCWIDGQRVADGVACISSRNSFTRFCFFNPDGSLESVCGNALFAIASLINNISSVSVKILPFDSSPIFISSNKDHHTVIAQTSFSSQYIIFESSKPTRIYNTGSPHLVLKVDDQNVNLNELGSWVTCKFNLNLTIFSVHNETIFARTFERGVEAETEACGTGAMAVAIESKICLHDISSIVYPGGTYDVKILKLLPQPIIALSANKKYVEVFESEKFFG
jgi:diaminopimelate epimerase